MNDIEKIYGSKEKYEKFKKYNDLIQAQKYLKDTDYIIIKMQEYSLLGKTVKEDYSDIMKKREECREVLRKLRKE